MDSGAEGGGTPKRSACDRCRRQKLRCNRENKADDCCQRCSKAGIPCETSPPLPMGSPPLSSDATPRQHTIKRKTGTLSKRRRLTNPSDDGQPGSEPGEPTPSVDPDFTETALFAHTKHPQDLPHENPARNRCSHHSGPYAGYRHQSQQRGPNLVGQSSANALDVSGGATLSETRSKILAGELTPELFVGLGEVDCNDLLQLDELNHMIDEFPSHASAELWPLEPMESQDSTPFRLGNVTLDSDLTRPPPDIAPAVDNINFDREALQALGLDNTVENLDHEENCLQELSSLGISLYRQSKFIRMGSWSDLFDHCISGNDTSPVGKLLYCSNRFVEIVDQTLCSSSSKPSSTAPNTPPPSSGKDSSPNTDFSSREFLGNPASLTDFSPPLFSFLHHQHATSEPFRIDNQAPLHHADTPTVLSILTCYTRLIYIYSCLFNRIRASFASSDSAIPSLPGLHVGGFKLHGELQMMILVQVCSYMLDRVNDALGLDDKGVGLGEGVMKGAMLNRGDMESGARALREEIGDVGRLLKEHWRRK